MKTLKEILDSKGADSMQARLYVSFVPTSLIELKQISDAETKEAYKKMGFGNGETQSKTAKILEYAALGLAEAVRYGAYAFFIYKITKF
jgi:hypothetical protein